MTITCNATDRPQTQTAPEIAPGPRDLLVPGSEAQFEDLSVEVATKLLRGLGQLVLRTARLIAVDDTLVIAAHSFHFLGQAHEFESAGMHALLLVRDVRLVLTRNRRELGAVVGSHRGLAHRVDRER